MRRPHVLDGSSAPLGVLESSGNCLGFRVGCEVGLGVWELVLPFPKPWALHPEP